MKRALIYLVAAIMIVAGIIVATRLRNRIHEAATDLKIIRGDTGDVMASATYQRFAKRREAVASMRSALLQVAAIESMFVADSGRPTTSLFGRYVPKDRYLLGPTIEIRRDRWVASVSHQSTTMSCTLTAMVDPITFDSVTWRYHVGQPVCAGWSAAESTALANAPVPINPAPQAEPPAEPLPAPRHHRDWGPVNNTPPRLPYVAGEMCEGEGCTYRGTWAACSSVVARNDKRLNAAPVFTIQPGERFTALTAEVHVLQPGLVVFRRPFTTTIEMDEAGLVDITFVPRDTLFMLLDLGEGVVIWRYRGSTMRGDMFWDEDPPAPNDSFGLIRPAKRIWWVKVRNPAGQEGWIVGDYAKMATGGYMDEVERCLRR